MRQNQSRAVLISLLTPTTTWQIAAYPYATEHRKPQKSRTKINLSTRQTTSMRNQWTPLIPLIYVTIYAPTAKLLHTLIKVNNIHNSSICSKRQFSASFTVVIRTLSTRLIKANFHISLSHRWSTAVSLETRNFHISLSHRWSTAVSLETRNFRTKALIVAPVGNKRITKQHIDYTHAQNESVVIVVEEAQILPEHRIERLLAYFLLSIGGWWSFLSNLLDGDSLSCHVMVVGLALVVFYTRGGITIRHMASFVKCTV